MPYPEAQLEAVRLGAGDLPQVVLVYRVLTGPREGQRIRLVCNVGEVQYIDLPEGALEEGQHANRSNEKDHTEENHSEKEAATEEDNQQDQHCECYECDECPHEDPIFCNACEEEFWE